MRVSLYAINVAAYPEKAEQMKIEDGYPSIRLYRGANHFVEFGKEEFNIFKTFDVQSIKKFLEMNNIK